LRYTVAWMRIATWNVNSLKVRLDKLGWWIDRARPDVLLLQETKLTDAAAPREELARLGYEIAHHGQGQWNGVAIVSRAGITDVVTNFGLARAVPAAGDESGDAEPLAEARMIAARCGDVRVVSLYAPNGRVVDSPFYQAKLAWYARLEAWLAASCRPDEPLVLGGDMNLAPMDDDVWDAKACHGGTHVSPRERDAFNRLLAWGLVDLYRAKVSQPERFSWWDYRAGHFPKNFGMRIDHLLGTAPVAARARWVEIDREARKGKLPSDHAPVLVDLDEPGHPLDAGWEGAAARRKDREAGKKKPA